MMIQANDVAPDDDDDDDVSDNGDVCSHRQPIWSLLQSTWNAAKDPQMMTSGSTFLSDFRHGVLQSSWLGRGKQFIIKEPPPNLC